MVTLSYLLKNINVEKIDNDFEKQITGIYYDSRKAIKNSIFVAIKGFKTDGHNYIDQAVNNGASTIVVEKGNSIVIPKGITVIYVDDTRMILAKLAATYYGFPSHFFNLVGVTGTNGKTSFTHLLKAILTKNEEKVGLIGTIANYIDDRVIPTNHTTPESTDLQEIFKKMIDNEVTYGVMEVSSHALELKRVEASEFDVAVFTNLTQDHLDFHSTLKDYLNAKAKLFKNLKKGVKNRSKYAVLNYDEENYEYLKQMINVDLVSYGLKEGSTYQAKNIELRIDGSTFELIGPFGSMYLNVKLAGIFSIYNCLAACSVALEEGIKPEIVKSALEAMQGVPGRFQLVDANQDFAVVVDYAHTPDSLENVLKTAKEVTDGKVIVVFGCGGDRDRSKRPIMGEKAALYSDYCIITSDNPRSEEPRAIIREIEPGVEKIKGNNYYVEVDRKKAIERAIEIANTGDIIIIAGKGHEDYQILADKTIYFDDVEVATEYLKLKK